MPTEIWDIRRLSCDFEKHGMVPGAFQVRTRTRQNTLVMLMNILDMLTVLGGFAEYSYLLDIYTTAMRLTYA